MAEDPLVSGLLEQIEAWPAIVRRVAAAELNSVRRALKQLPGADPTGVVDTMLLQAADDVLGRPTRDLLGL